MVFVPGPRVKRVPGFTHLCCSSPQTSSSMQVHPMPWTKPPSTCTRRQFSSSGIVQRLCNHSGEMQCTCCLSKIVSCAVGKWAKQNDAGEWLHSAKLDQYEAERVSQRITWPDASATWTSRGQACFHWAGTGQAGLERAMNTCPMSMAGLRDWPTSMQRSDLNRWKSPETRFLGSVGYPWE